MSLRIRCEYLPENFFAYAAPSAAGPSKSLAIVIAGAETTGPWESTCLIAPKDGFAPGATDDSFLRDCALVEPIALRVMAALRRNRRRLLMAASGMVCFPGAIRRLACDHVCVSHRCCRLLLTSTGKRDARLPPGTAPFPGPFRAQRRWRYRSGARSYCLRQRTRSPKGSRLTNRPRTIVPRWCQYPKFWSRQRDLYPTVAGARCASVPAASGAGLGCVQNFFQFGHSGFLSQPSGLLEASQLIMCPIAKSNESRDAVFCG